MPIAKPDIEGIRKFVDLRKKGLTYSQVALVMGKNKRTLTRWNKYIVDKKFSTEFLAMDK